MHESSLARRVLDVVLDRAGGAGRIVRITGWIAEDEALSSESLAFHFQAHARGTAAEGASLELSLRHLTARCRRCGGTFAPEHHVRLCPGCGSTDAELDGPAGLAVESIEVDGGGEP